jgi:hypothetical protein
MIKFLNIQKRLPVCLYGYRLELEIIQHYYLEQSKLRLIISFENNYTSRHYLISWDKYNRHFLTKKDMITTERLI